MKVIIIPGLIILVLCITAGRLLAFPALCSTVKITHKSWGLPGSPVKLLDEKMAKVCLNDKLNIESKVAGRNVFKVNEISKEGVSFVPVETHALIDLGVVDHDKIESARSIANSSIRPQILKKGQVWILSSASFDAGDSFIIELTEIIP